MLDTIENYFGSTGFMPHGHCFLWTPSLLWSYVATDSVIAVAYYSIPFALWHLARKRRDLPYRWIFVLFGAFVMACGTTHLFAVWNIWHPDYWADAAIKVFTAVMSIIAAVTLWHLMPHALKIPTRQELYNEIKRRERAEEELRKLNRQSEALNAQRLHLLGTALRASANAVVITDIQGNIQWVNSAFTTLTGYDAEEAVGKNPRQLVKSGKHEQAFYKNLWNTILAGNIWRGETNNRRKDGSCYIEDQTITPVRDDHGKITHFIAIKLDITERKQAEAALRSSETQLSNAIKMAHLGHWEFDVAKDQFTFNDHFYALLRTTAQREGGYTMSSTRYSQRFVHPDDFAIVGREIQQALETTDPNYSHELEHRVIFGDGESGHVTVRIFIAKDSQGRTIKTYGVNQDITERKRVERALRANEQKFRMLSETTADTVIVMNEDNIIQFVNDSVKKMFGYSPEEVIGQDLAILQPESFRQKHRDGMKHYLETAQKSVSWNSLETWGLHHDGHVFPVEIAFSDISVDGLRQFGGFIRDITERKRTEELLIAAEQHNRHLLNSSPSVIYATSGDSADSHHCAFVSDTLTHMTGYWPQQMINDPRFWLAHVHPDDVKRTLSEIEHHIQQGGGSLEYRFQHKNGEYRWIRDTFRVITNARGRPTEIVGAWTDITDSRRTEEQLAQSQKMEAVGQLTGGVAHDFNNRLTVIIGNLELLQRKLGNDPAIGDRFKSILSAAEGAADLTRQLLTFSRQQVLEPKVININELITGMCDLLQRTLGETIKVITAPGQDLWPVRIDRTLFENVLLNLAVNARDAMPRGGQLTIETENVTLGGEYVETHTYVTQGDYIRTSVSDTGAGMSEEIKRRVFEPFFTTKPAGKGTGLGLAMVYGFVKQSGGHIEIYSEMGHGTTFKIYLPKDASAKGASSAAPEKKASDKDAVTRSKVILLVEDDDAVRKLASLLLTEMGCRVLIANSGLEAFELFKSHPEIDLLFTDMVMPGGMTGIELAAKVRERLPELKVLYTSGYAPQAAADRRTIEHPNDFWLAKPYRSQTLRETMRQILDVRTGH